MAIIVDPDLLDRNQVLYNATSQEISLYPVGALVASTARGDGQTTISSWTFTCSGVDFTALGVLAGDILLIKI